MNVRHTFEPGVPPRPSGMTAAPAARPARRLPGVLTTAAGLAALWAGLTPGDPASWAIGIPTAMLGAAASALLPPAALPRVSIPGTFRFAAFVIAGVVRGALDVALRSLAPATLKPGLLVWHTSLPEGGARRLFALTITLLPGTLTARLDGGTLLIHTLDRSATTRADLGALEARIARLVSPDAKRALP